MSPDSQDFRSGRDTQAFLLLRGVVQRFMWRRLVPQWGCLPRHSKAAAALAMLLVRSCCGFCVVEVYFSVVDAGSSCMIVMVRRVPLMCIRGKHLCRPAQDAKHT
jgi:hypothetical protein